MNMRDLPNDLIMNRMDYIICCRVSAYTHADELTSLVFMWVSQSVGRNFQKRVYFRKSLTQGATRPCLTNDS